MVAAIIISTATTSTMTTILNCWGLPTHCRQLPVAAMRTDPFMVMHNNHHRGIVIMLLAMVIGFAMGLLLAKKNGSSRGNRRHKYHSINW